MSQFRIVGIACDALIRFTDEGVRVDTYGTNAVGADCGEEFTLLGGATYAEVERDAKRDGWKIVGSGRAKTHLCPTHKAAAVSR